MHRLRRQLSRHHYTAILLVVLALFMKFAVPAGFMPDTADGQVRLVMCSGFGAEKVMTMAMPGMAHHDDKGGQGQKETPCGFSGHAPGAMATVDPIVLALAIAFIITTVFRIPAAPGIKAVSYLRPHLRGPPAIV